MQATLYNTRQCFGFVVDSAAIAAGLAGLDGASEMMKP
jgi:hypothetical protein